MAMLPVLETSPDPIIHHSTPAYIIQRQQIIYSTRYTPLLYLRIFPVLERNPSSNPDIATLKPLPLRNVDLLNSIVVSF